MAILRKGSYANVTASAALVVALGGADIKNGTVASTDVKNNTLRLKDISTKAQASLKGATGPAGAAGSQGATGPSNVYAVYNDNASGMMAATFKDVLTLDLGPASYAVSSKAVATVTTTTPGEPWAECLLQVPVAQDKVAATMTGTFANTASLANQIVFASAVPLQVILSCRGDTTALTWKRMTAIKVEAVSNTAGADVP